MIFDVLHAGRFGANAVPFARLALCEQTIVEMEQQCAHFHRALMDHLDAIARARYSTHTYCTFDRIMIPEHICS